SMGDTLGDFYTVKTDNLGDSIWTNKFGGAQMDLGNDIVESITGEFIVGGETKSFGLGGSDGIIVKISPLGVSGFTYTIGVSANDDIQSVSETVDGKIEMAGVTNSYGFANGKGDIIFFIINPDYTVHNVTTFGTTASERVYSVENTADKGAILCGTTTGFNNLLEDFYLIKTDSLGGSTFSESVFITSIQSHDSDAEYNFSLYPNPASDQSYINIQTQSEKVSISILDMVGKQLYSENVSTNGTSNISVPLNLSELANGVYLVRVETELGIHSKRIVVSH
ncbi:MAG: T9SS type A sorting domain-containing protein, partial [Bacteroidota bacterium]|nr:T9SS type A sorting domain-containing protein [Bacteroidota bacterium]